MTRFASVKVDWSKVPVDTRIWVRGSETGKWKPRYFAKYQDGLVHAWTDGSTSWSSNDACMPWTYAKLAEE